MQSARWLDPIASPGGGLAMARRPAALIPRRGMVATVRSRPEGDAYLRLIHVKARRRLEKIHSN